MGSPRSHLLACSQVEIDQINKPFLPVAAGRISPKLAWALVVGSGALCQPSLRRAPPPSARLPFLRALTQRVCVTQSSSSAVWSVSSSSCTLRTKSFNLERSRRASAEAAPARRRTRSSQQATATSPSSSASSLAATRLLRCRARRRRTRYGARSALLWRYVLFPLVLLQVPRRHASLPPRRRAPGDHDRREAADGGGDASSALPRRRGDLTIRARKVYRGTRSCVDLRQSQF